jgi:hypothetical protein
MPLDTIVSHTKSVYNIPPYLFMILFNIIPI